MSGLAQTLGLGRTTGNHQGSVPLPLYSPIATSEAANERASQSDSDDATTVTDGSPLHAAQKHARHDDAAPSIFAFPTRARFLADFTLGFADGLTVPFALTAGLSSLGQTDTVIYAGMAEICAGSISMGIGGYLSARGENLAACKESSAEETRDEEDAEKGALASGNETSASVTEYLAPLDLPAPLLQSVLAHIESHSAVQEAIEIRADQDRDDTRLCSSVMVGLSVSLGYLLGGLLPLFPYFLVDQVSDGLLWSFAVCVVALFVFGFGKDVMLRRENQAAEWSGQSGQARGLSWRALRGSVWEGLQMVILGSAAAIAAVLCVKAFESMRVPSESS